MNDKKVIHSGECISQHRCQEWVQHICQQRQREYPGWCPYWMWLEWFKRSGKKWKHRTSGKDKYLESKRKAKRAVYQAWCEVDRSRFSNILRKNDPKYDLLKFAKRMVKSNQDGEQRRDWKIVSTFVFLHVPCMQKLLNIQAKNVHINMFRDYSNFWNPWKIFTEMFYYYYIESSFVVFYGVTWDICVHQFCCIIS